jgi:hypothetical protein
VDTEIAIQMLHGVPVEKQTDQCWQFAVAQGWPVSTISPQGGADQVIRLVELGQVKIVVMPFVDRESVEIEARVIAAGGKVAYCRQPPPRLSVDTSDVILHLYRKGHREVGELAAILRATPERIRRALRRSGVNEPDG